jgi:hypothetical protein
VDLPWARNAIGAVVTLMVMLPPEVLLDCGVSFSLILLVSRRVKDESLETHLPFGNGRRLLACSKQLKHRDVAKNTKVSMYSLFRDDRDSSP